MGGRRDVDVTYFEVGGEEFATIGVPLPVELPACLTNAERAVTILVFAGHSNAEIARIRGTSVRTIANQLASVMKKLDVKSRADLVVRLTSDAGSGADGHQP